MFLQSSNRKIEKVLQLKNRRKTYEFVKKYSGSHFREIERKSNIPYGTLKYHLNFLVKHKILIQKKENNNVRYFSANFQPENIALLSFLRQIPTRKIILFILTNENCNHEDIVHFVQLSPSTVSWHLNRLAAAKIVASKRVGRKVEYKIAINKEEIIKLLVTYKESFLDSLVNKTVEMWELR